MLVERVLNLDDTSIVTSFFESEMEIGKSKVEVSQADEVLESIS